MNFSSEYKNAKNYPKSVTILKSESIKADIRIKREQA